MGIGENPRKIQNIVENNMEHFRDLYANSLDHLIESGKIKIEQESYKRKDEMFSVQLSQLDRAQLLADLPEKVRFYLCDSLSLGHRDISDSMFSVFSRSHLNVAISFWLPFSEPASYSRKLRGCIKAIVYRRSLEQTAKGLFTAGISKSARYSWSKLRKANKGGKYQN